MALVNAQPPDAAAEPLSLDGLRTRTVRGAVASTSSQVLALLLRTGSMVALSRLLLPRDFGLVAMATAITGFLSLFRDFGLSTASVQRLEVTEDQVSTLFWINLTVGALLAAACAGIAPLLVLFYGEPRLLQITLALATGFLLNGAAVQHRALLQRSMRFGAMALVDTSALVIAIAVAISMAMSGFGYWSVVAITVLPQIASALGVWIAARWVPGPPNWAAGIAPFLKFGGTLTLNSLVVQLAYNTDKILLGRFWGADALGVYSRAYQLVNLPVDGLNSAISQVALPALARVQDDAERLRRHFLQGYGVFLAIMVPVAAACGLFADDIIRVFLGASWTEAAPVFRRLVPTMLVLAMINPLSWLMLSTGRTLRSLLIAVLIAPTVVVGCIIGLPAGPEGVAMGVSGAMLLLVVPVVLWARHGTTVTGADVGRQSITSIVAAGIAGIVAMQATRYTAAVDPPILRLTLDSIVFFTVFVAVMLLWVGDRSIYSKMIRTSMSFQD